MSSPSLLIITQAVDANDPNLGFFIQWIEEFARCSPRVSVICLRKGSSPLPDTVPVYSLGKEEGGSRVRYVTRFFTYLWRLRDTYDAVVVHMNPEYLVLAGWWWRLTRKRTLLWYAHKSVTPMLRIAERFVDVICTASPESFRLPSRKVQVMGHGIDMHRRQPPHTPIPEPGVIRCYSSGRISASKGIETLLAAYTELAQRGKHVTLALYGAPITREDEAYEKRLTTALSEKGIDPSTLFKGAVPHKELPYRRAEAEYFLHASTTGSLDKAVLDAVVSGLLPITSSQAYRELLGEYEPLLTYPEGDASALADRILELERLTTEEKETIRTTLRERVAESHSLESLVRRLYALLAL